MDQKPLHEISRRSITINKCEEPSISWQNSFLTVRTEKGLNLLYFSQDLQSMDKQIDWCMTSIPSPKSCPATSLFSSKLKRRCMNNLEHEHTTMQPSLVLRNPLLLEDLASVISFEWSPQDFIHNNESVLAILTNVGNVELYGPKGCGFKSILSISSVIEKRYKENSNSLSQELEDFKEGIGAVVTSAICWGNEHKGAFIFVTAQKNGDTHFWNLKCEGETVNIDLLTTIDTKHEEIVTMRWIPFSNDEFFIVVANNSGQLFMYRCHWENSSIKLVNHECLWSHKDRYVISHITYSKNGDSIVLMFNKQKHLITQLVGGNCNQISQSIYSFRDSDSKITSLSENDNEFYVSMLNCKVYRVTVTISNIFIKINTTPVLIKESFANKELYDVQFSKNKIICALALVDRKIMHRKENATVDIIFLCQEANHEKEISCLLTNTAKSLTDYNDCIEMLRYKTMKLKILPTIDYIQFYLNSTKDLYKMKVYLILLTLYNTLDKILRNGSKGWLPETSLEVIREKILALHATYVMTDLYSKTQGSKHLEGLQAETFAGSKKYLNYYCQKYNVPPTDLVSSDVFNVTEIDRKYTCQCCDQEINGFSCSNGHLNMFCGLTLTPIQSDDYLICKRCGILARVELLDEKPVCVFCDVHLNNYSLPS